MASILRARSKGRRPVKADPTMPATDKTASFGRNRVEKGPFRAEFAIVVKN
jgi:hypothetical protein